MWVFARQTASLCLDTVLHPRWMGAHHLTSTVSNPPTFTSSGYRPSLDFDYILNHDNREDIHKNIHNRKQVGNIEVVHKLWSQLESILLNKPPDISESQVETLWNLLYEEASKLPNKTHPACPTGSTPKTVDTFGQKPNFDFEAKAAEEILSRFNLYKSDKVISQLAGPRSFALIGNLSVLERKLAKLAVKKAISHGFIPIYVPDVLNKQVPNACGLMQRSDKGILYSIKSNPEYCLSGTAEMGIASYLAEKTFRVSDLPLKFVATSKCYRPEVSEGKIEHGLYRVHEFTKVELFTVTEDDLELSQSAHNEILQFEIDFFSLLGIHFKVEEMPSQELGAPAYRKFDIEAFLPGRNIYGELSSCSNCTDYQSRRLNLQYIDNDGKLRYPHTVNGTAVATTRALIALIETYQRKNWGLKLPEFLSLDNSTKNEKFALKLKAINPKNDLR